jgi:1-acyl-sn-glycerol-3-phosphate acyltransferase
MKPPPYIVRRVVIAPLVVVSVVFAFGLLPLWMLIAAFVSRYVPGRWRILRVAWFLFVYLALEALGLIVLFAIWIVSGFGWKLRSPSFQEAHYQFMAWWLRRVMGSARRTFRISIDVELPDEPPTLERPLLVLSRHAGPGDSFLLIDALLNGDRPRRRPRIVLKDLLQWDPCVDVLVNRLPNRFVPAGGGGGHEAIGAIADLTSTMSGGDAFVIFPEGGNFTPRRRARAIEKLDEIGRPGLADRARSMEHLLPPKPAGALAAIEAAPDADVLFVGHVGLDGLSTMRDLWRGIPMDAAVVARYWITPADQVPPPADRERWLYDRWQDLDAWIDGVVDQRET